MPTDTMPTAAMLVIGDEILSGRTRDANMHHLAKALTDHGIRLEEVRIVADVHDRIVAAVRALSAGHDHLFTSGGIGPTHDDITADAVAEAMGAHLDVRDDARAILQAHYDRQGMEMNDARLRMARIPDGRHADRQPDLRRAGVHARQRACHGRRATIFEAMLASCPADADRRAADAVPIAPRGAWRRGHRGALGDLAAAHPEVSIGSYPFQRDGVHGSNVVVRSQNGAAVDRVMAELARLFPEAG
jgi:molybdenum cofactor synthesis domain-containing protein